MKKYSGFRDIRKKDGSDRLVPNADFSDPSLFNYCSFWYELIICLFQIRASAKFEYRFVGGGAKNPGTRSAAHTEVHQVNSGRAGEVTQVQIQEGGSKRKKKSGRNGKKKRSKKGKNAGKEVR